MRGAFAHGEDMVDMPELERSQSETYYLLGRPGLCLYHSWGICTGNHGAFVALKESWSGVCLESSFQAESGEQKQSMALVLELVEVFCIL